MTLFQPERSQRGAEGFQAIGDDAFRFDTFVAKRAFQQRQASAGVAPLLHDEIQDFALVIDPTSEKYALAIHVADRLVEVPARRGRRLAAAKVLCDLRAELVHPAADGLVAHADPALSQHLLNVSKAHGNPEI